MEQYDEKYNFDCVDIITKTEKTDLCASMIHFVNEYMADRTIPKRLKSNILLCKYNDIIFNLKNSTYLKNKISNKQIDIALIPYLQPYELNEQYWIKLIEKNNNKIKVKENKKFVTIYKCFKCGKNMCMTEDLQTASIDEPMTRFIYCLNCGNSWKLH